MLTALGVAAAIATIGLGGHATLRLWFIWKAFASGLRISGRIVRVDTNSEDVESVLVEYQLDGRDHRIRNVTESLRGQFQVGEPVELAIDPRRPRRAYLARLYG